MGAVERTVKIHRVCLHFEGAKGGQSDVNRKQVETLTQLLCVEGIYRGF